MLYSSASYFFVFAILFALLDTGICYKCYTCAGALHVPPDVTKVPLPVGIPLISSCIDPIDTRNIPTTDCTEEQNACTKFISTVRGVKLMLRGCFNPNDCKQGPDECYHCKDDLCNSSTTVVPSWVAVCTLSLVFVKNML